MTGNQVLLLAFLLLLLPAVLSQNQAAQPGTVQPSGANTLPAQLPSGRILTDAERLAWRRWRRRLRRQQRVRALMQSSSNRSAASSPSLNLYNSFATTTLSPATTTTSPPPTTTISTASTTTSTSTTADPALDYLLDILDDEPAEATEAPVQADEVHRNLPREGQLRLVGGRTETEGNIQIYHRGMWGSICDDEWDMAEARIACKQLGYPGAIGPTHSSQFGYAERKIWMDNMYCYGTEESLEDCRFDGWGVHDCESTEAAGVRCEDRPPPTTPAPPTTTPRPLTEIADSHVDMELRLAGGRTTEEGRVEVRLAGHSDFGPICGDGWGLREAVVVCRELGLGYAQSALQTYHFSPAEALNNAQIAQDNDTMQEPSSSLERVVLTGVSCLGNEESLHDCKHDADNFCPGTGALDVAGVVCVEEQADLEPDIYELMSSTHLEDKQLFFMQCAMEENCVASQAYHIQKTRHDWHHETRRLLRFTSSIANVGNADFKPFIPKSRWEWHSCHQHYHSMEVFAHFEITDLAGNRVAEGHKASFCLEDNHCSGVDPKYDCENYGDQGITAGCKDIYYYNIDCQWIDITELALGNYVFRMAINPEYKVGEQTFENNAAVCTLTYMEQFAFIRNCTLQRP